MNALTLPPAPKRASDTDLAAALQTIALDYVAGLAEDREAHGRAAAHVMATGRLSAYYSAILLACDEAADRWRKGGAP